MRNKVLVAILLLVAGLVLLPVENAVRAERVQLKYGGARVSVAKDGFRILKVIRGQ